MPTPLIVDSELRMLAVLLGYQPVHLGVWDNLFDFNRVPVFLGLGAETESAALAYLKRYIAVEVCTTSADPRRW